MRALRFLLRKEFLQIRRDRMILGMLLIMPMAQLLVLSNAATFEVKNARLYVVDHDHSPMSRGVVDRLAASRRFVPVAASPSVERADRAMLNRDIDVILVIPRDFERDVVRNRTATVQLILNAEDGAAAGVTRAYAGEVLTRYAAELGAEVNPVSATVAALPDRPPQPGQPVIEIRRRGWYNADLDYGDYMVPGILVAVVTIISTLLTAMNIVREKEAGTLDQLNVTPVTRSTFIAAKLIPLWSIALLDLALGLVVARLVFDVPMRGNPALIFLAGGIYLFAALGFGLWVSTVAETQQQAMFVTYSVLLVYILMSGLFTPVSSMPEWAQWVAQTNPLTHFVRLMRAVLVKGAGLTDVARELAILTAMGAALLAVAVRQYRKRAG